MSGAAAARSRFLTHTRYVLQDYLLLRAALPAGLVFLVTGLFVWNRLDGVRPEFRADPRFLAAMHQQYGSFAGALLYFTIFLAVIAVMTVDRTTGCYRFFFSKPVNVVGYYLHTFCVHGVAVCGLLAVFAFAYGTALPHESLHRAAAAGAIAFALIGGLGFFFGALTNADAALAPLAFIFATSAQFTLIDYTRPPLWLVYVAKILPPAVDFEKSRSLLYAPKPLVAGPLWHVLAYGVLAWLLGVILLRWRPLAR